MKPSLIPNNGNGYVNSYFYTDLGINGGAKYELPFPGAMATSWWDLQGIESLGQKLPTLKSITLDGSEYILNLDSNSQTYYINVNGQRQTVTSPTLDYSTFYSNINGQDYWNITQNGWTLNYGNYTQQSGQLTISRQLDYNNGLRPNSTNMVRKPLRLRL